MTKEQSDMNPFTNAIIFGMKAYKYGQWKEFINGKLKEYASLRCKLLVDALREIVNGSGGKLSKEDRSRMLRIASDALIKWKSESALSQYNEGVPTGWQSMDSAPKDGSTIEISYDEKGEDICLAMWSERPVCMGGPTVSIKPGWATASESNTDTNLPLDPPVMWRPYHEEVVPEPDWVLVTDKLPNLFEPNKNFTIDVLVTDGNYIDRGCYSIAGEYWHIATNSRSYTPTHWRSLPALPIAEGKGEEKEGNHD